MDRRTLICRAVDLVLLSAIMGWALSGSAQGNAACKSQEVLVSVVTDEYQPVAGATADRFRGRIRGKDVVVTDATPFSGPRRAVLLLDASGSMQNKWNFAVPLLGNIVANAPDNLWLAMVLVSEKNSEQIPFSETGRLQIEDRVRYYRDHPKLPFGKTALIDGLEWSLILLQPGQPGDAIYLISDGGENSSKERIERLQRNLLSSRVRLFSIVLKDKIPLTVEEKDDFVRLENLSDQSGGFAIRIEGPQATAELRNGIPAILQDQSVRLRIRVADAVEKPTPWNLQFVDANGKPARRVAVHYPHTLQPCEGR